MNLVYTAEIYNFTKSSTMWAILLAILILIVVISLLISIKRKYYGIFAGTFAICIGFIFISIMGFFYPISALDYKDEKELLDYYNYKYDKYSGAYINDTIIFYKKGKDNYYLICKNYDKCDSFEIADMLKKSINIGFTGIEKLNNLTLERKTEITVIKDQNTMTISNKNNSIYYYISTNKEYLDKEKKEVNDLPNSIEFNSDKELEYVEEYSLILSVFSKYNDDFEYTFENGKIRYEEKVSVD